jgi:cell volume regulation protein A
MHDPNTILLGVAALLVLGTVGELLFLRTNVPDALWLVLAGAIGNQVLGAVGADDLHAIAPYLSAFALTIILFDAGSHLRLDHLVRSASRGTLLSVIVFAASVTVVAGLALIGVRIGLLPAAWGVAECILVGVLLGGTSPVILLPAIRAVRPDSEVLNLIGIETAIGEILAIAATGSLIRLLVSGDGGAASFPLALAGAVGLGLLGGVIGGALAILAARLRLSHVHTYALLLAGLLGLYVITVEVGGSPALAVLTAALVLSNAQLLAPRLARAMELQEPDPLVRATHSQLAFVMKIVFFLFMGALLQRPSPAFWIGIGLGAALFVVRVPLVWATLRSTAVPGIDKRIMTVAMPRGLVAGMLALLPVSAGLPSAEVYPSVAYAAILATIVLFTLGFPVAVRLPLYSLRRLAVIPVPHDRQ